MSECKHPRFNKDLYDYCPDCGADWYAAEGGKRIAELQARIALLEAEELGFMKTSLEYKRRIALLEAAGAKIISAIRVGLSQDEIEAMEEFELLLQEQGE